MKFTSLQFPNVSLTNGSINVKFVDGEYATDDPKEIELLKNSGFEVEGKKPPNLKK